MVDEFLRCGVTDAVLSPGSRSTPLAMALAAAEARGEITLHVRLDERSAGYLAVGIARVTGVPPIVVTTSGTAAVNLHPALVEADQSGIAIIAVTADRPPELRGVGSNQTIRQAAIFGSDVRLAVDMATATRAPGSVRYWRSTVARVVSTATDAVSPGPVHLNVPFCDPLVPDGDDSWVETLDGRPDGRPWTADARLVAGMSTPLDDALDSLLEDQSVPARGIVVLGDHDDPESVELADELSDALGWPVIAEPSGNGAGCTTALSHGPLLLADSAFADAHVPHGSGLCGRTDLAGLIGPEILKFEALGDAASDGALGAVELRFECFDEFGLVTLASRSSEMVNDVLDGGPSFPYRSARPIRPLPTPPHRTRDQSRKSGWTR